MKTGWEAKKLGEVCEVFTDGDWIESKDQSSSGIRLIQTGNVGEGYFKNREGKARYISEDTFRRLQCTEIFKGDCLVSRLPDPVGRSCLIPELDKKMITAVDCTIIRFNEKILPAFFKYYTQTAKYLKDIDRETTGTTRKRISRSKLGDITIPVPSISEQQRIAALLDDAFTAIAKTKENAQKNLQNARELFESYLERVFANSAEDWEEKKLGDNEVLQIIDGDRGVNYPSRKDFSNKGYCLFLNTKNVRPDGFCFDSVMFISKEKDGALRKGKLKKNDVIMTTRGTIGNVAVYDDNVDYENVRINSGMLIFRPNVNVLLSDYLFEILRSSIIKAQIKKYSTGAAQPQLPIKTLVNFVFPLPKEIDKQKDIVIKIKEIFNYTQKLENLYQKKLDDLEELKKSILQKAFTGEL